VNTFRSDVLGPDDLQLAAEAFQAALYSLDEARADIHPYTARQLVARSVIHQAFKGQRDLDKLRDGALACLAAARALAS
jgi:hypothetical protein